MRDAIFSSGFREDLTFFVRTDRKLAQRLLRLVEEILRGPFRGIGKPEPLKHIGSDVWSRRLTQADRIVYRVTDRGVYFLQARYHYGER